MLRKAVDLVIESDASLIGWGAVCNHQQTGGPWSREEQNLHINCLELLAATLALKSFTKGQTGLSVLLKMDNTTAVAYVNNQGGTVSRELVRLSKELWTWCLQRNITIKAQHLPGRLNQVADSESRTMLEPVGLETRLTSLSTNPSTLGPNGGGFVCLQTDNTVPSLFQLAARSICSSNRCLPPSLDGAQGICKSAMEFGGTSGSTGSGSASLAGASSTCVEDPALVPNSTGDAGRCPTPDPPQRQATSRSQMRTPQLAAWPISEENAEITSFRRKLARSSLARGGKKQINSTTPSLGDGIAGVVDRVPIHFQAL